MDMTKKLAFLGFAITLLTAPCQVLSITENSDVELEEELEEDEEYEEEEEVVPPKAPTMPLTKAKVAPKIPLTKTVVTPQMPRAKKPALPVQKPATPVKLPAPQKAALPKIPPAAPAVPPGETHKAELEKINQTLKTIDTLKDTLKDLLTQFDEAIEKGRGLATQARTKSLEILKAKTAADAQKIKTQITTDLETLKKMQQDLETNLGKNFQTTAEQIKSNITTVQDTIKTLQAKGVTFKLAQATQEPIQAKKRKTTFFARLKKEVSTNEKKSDESFGRYLARRMGDLVIGIFGIFYTTYKSIKNLLFGAEKIPTQKEIPQNLTPPKTPPKMPTQMPQNAMPSAQAEGTVNQYDQLVSKLEKNRMQLEEQTLQLESTVLNIRKTLEHDQAIGQHIDDYYPWKETIINGVSYIIDSAIYLASSTVSGAKKIFQYYVKPAAKKVTHDVQAKIKEDEKKSAQLKKILQEEQLVEKEQFTPSLPQTK